MRRSGAWLLAALGLIGVSMAPVSAQQGPPYASPSYGAPSYGAPSYESQPSPQYGQPQPPAEEQQPALLSPDQLDNLVAPIALYPDQLLSEILAASTYPLEIVDADQWLQQNRNLPADQRLDAAKQQPWDPSVQALAAFPDVLDILGRDVRWTTDLGNAFLAQQADVMNAIQAMRARARQSGQLRSTPQQTVETQTQGGQSAIQIQPTDPQTIYPPVYDPNAVWGPPAYGAYPSLWYPPAWGYGALVGLARIAFAPAIFIGGLFSGLLGFGGWGWGLSWFAHSLFFNPLFFSHFGFHGYGGGYGGYHGAMVAGHPVWAHDPGHRLGVPYSNRAVASRFGGRVGGAGLSTAARGSFGSVRPPAGNQFAMRSAPSPAAGRQSFAQETRGFAGSYNRAAPAEGYRGAQSFAAPRAQNFAAPRAQNFAAPRAQQQTRPPQNMARSYSAPHASSPHGSSSHASSSHGGGGGHSSGGHSSGHKH